MVFDRYVYLKKIENGKNVFLIAVHYVIQKKDYFIEIILIKKMNLVIIYLDGFDCNFDKVNHQQKKVEKKIHSDYYVIMEDVTVGNNIEIL